MEKNADKRILKDTIERVLPCVLDGRRFPLDIKRSIVQRASNPVSMESWEWRKSTKYSLCGNQL